jgi:CCR4-NOT transcription complex subunit 1
VLDIAQVIKESLIPLTNWNDYDFAVPLAILAGKREFLHFEPWITDRIKNIGNPFLKSILGYIEDHLLSPIRKLIETKQNFSYEFMLEKAQLSKELLAFIFESIFLTTSSSKMTKRNLESLKRIYKEKWTKKRGSENEELTGHETSFFYNEVPVSLSEYKKIKALDLSGFGI